MTYEEAILVKIDRKTKRQMSYANANWSELIREFIRRELQRKRKVSRAERLRAKLFRSMKGPDSTEIVRAMRDSRYGPSGS